MGYDRAGTYLKVVSFSNQGLPLQPMTPIPNPSLDFGSKSRIAGFLDSFGNPVLAQVSGSDYDSG